MAERTPAAALAQRVDGGVGAEPRLERPDRRRCRSCSIDGIEPKSGMGSCTKTEGEPAISAILCHHSMNSDPPKYRPLERFWPYAELPEQPTDEELAALDPDLHEALFGAQPRPFSITLVFPALESPEFPRALDLARALGRVPRNRQRRAAPVPRAVLVERCRRLRDLFQIVGRRTRPKCSSTIGRCRTRASCGCRSSGSSSPGDRRGADRPSTRTCSASKPISSSSKPSTTCSSPAGCPSRRGRRAAASRRS